MKKNKIFSFLAIMGLTAGLLSFSTSSLAGVGGCYYKKGHGGGCLYLTPPPPRAYYPYPAPVIYYPPASCRRVIRTRVCTVDAYGFRQCTMRNAVRYVC